jgi:FAD binding domain in molybdopterin dehydrogenase
MKEDVERPSRLIDISRLPLNKVEETADGGVRIGALVPNSDLAYHPLIEQRYPMFGSAILAGASQHGEPLFSDNRGRRRRWFGRRFRNSAKDRPCGHRF